MRLWEERGAFARLRRLSAREWIRDARCRDCRLLGSNAGEEGDLRTE